jgi:hypothetical protein
MAHLKMGLPNVAIHARPHVLHIACSVERVDSLIFARKKAAE